jgi:iron complex transport system permease protein
MALRAAPTTAASRRPGERERAISNLNRPIGLLIVLVVVIAGACVVSILVGAAPLAPARVWQGLWTGAGAEGILVRDIRLPRLILSLSIGGFLGLSGAALQGLLRNPLADATVFGAPQAAALGAVVTLYFGFADALSFALPFMAIGGAVLSAALLYALGWRRRNILNLILAGLAIGSLSGAAVALAINLSANPFAMTEIIFWLMGSLEDRSMRHVALALPFLIVAAAILLRQGNGFRAMTLGEDAAASLGINVRRLQLLTVAGVAIGTGASVAVSGAIGFVGLVTPHLVRPFLGGDPKKTLWAAGLAGAALLTLADILVRVTPASSEIRLGVVTAFLGAPAFLWIVMSQRAMFDESSR